MLLVLFIAGLWSMYCSILLSRDREFRNGSRVGFNGGEWVMRTWPLLLHCTLFCFHYYAHSLFGVYYYIYGSWLLFQYKNINLFLT